MKKLYSTILMLATMVAALSLTACSSSSDDDNDDGGGFTSSFSITYDGQRNDVENVEWLNPHFGNGDYNKGNYFCLESSPLGNG